MAQNAKDIQMRELKDLLSELRETNKLLRNALEETQKEKAVLQRERDNFKEQVDYLTKTEIIRSSSTSIPKHVQVIRQQISSMGFRDI